MTSPRHRILIVCTGNLCRSPLAMAYLRYLNRQHRLCLEVQSAGIMPVTGAKPPQPVLDLAHSVAVDLRTHQPHMVTPHWLHWADRVLVMEPGHARWITQRNPEVRAKIDILSRWLPGGDPDDQGIPDPYGSDMQTYQTLWIIMKHALERWLVQRLGLPKEKVYNGKKQCRLAEE